MEYNFKEIENRWQNYWRANKTYKVDIEKDKQKYYVLDMFPYPSGAGLHVGHPLGYIASDIYSRFMRLNGYNVLHPMGYDAFGLPAEQFAIETGQHPAITTENNIKRYREQLDKIGFSYDWSREVRTSDPDYYHWTQWAFIKMFHHWFNLETQKAEPIETLIEEFERAGNTEVKAACNEDTPMFYAEVWRGMDNEERQKVLLKYRLAYLADTMVNWCPALGTVLANDEVKDGLSTRGEHQVEQKKMKQWLLRVSAYAERLLSGLETIDWTDSLKEMQRNWIGRSEGAEILFPIKGKETKINIFTTRPDTVYGATFMVLAPESELVDLVTTHEYREKIDDYISESKKRTERERMMDTKTVSGQFTGGYAINPFSNEAIPIWIADYVLAGYGTGAIMAVPAHDSRDFTFAKHFGLPIIQVIDGADIEAESYDDKTGKIINSGIINGMEVDDAIQKIIQVVEEKNIGSRKVNYRLRDAIFSRQRYWGEPFPVYFKNDIPYTIPETDLPLELPEVDTFRPTEEGEPPLARAENWYNKDEYPYELSTMPGFAGSSAYYLRYMDPKNNHQLVSKEANEYWQDVDLYIGGTEHATGHLIYSRFWNKFLYDLGYVCKDEPFRKLINQGMIQGRSNFVYRANTRKYAKAVIGDFLRNNSLGYKFKTDFNYNHEIYDFECEEKHLIIEIQTEKQAKAAYEKYSKLLKNTPYRLLVLTAEEVAEDLQATIGKITAVLEEEIEIPLDFPDDEIAYRPLFISKELLKPAYDASEIRVDVNIVHNDILDIDAFRKWRYEYENAIFVTKNGMYQCGNLVEKMSKSKYNVVNPDTIIEDYGADTLRLYEMFLGPLEQSKPWDMNGIEGVHKFLRKYWRLFFDNNNNADISEKPATKDELKTLHKTIKKVQQDIKRFSFNTAVSAFMICVNELQDLKCNKREILEPLTVLLAPFAPHITEELWHVLGKQQTVCDAEFPAYNEEYLKEDEITYPVAFNGKRRYEINVPAGLDNAGIEKIALEHEKAAQYVEEKNIRKVIIVPKRMVNIVVS